jgi:hypothetical protein
LKVVKETLFWSCRLRIDIRLRGTESILRIEFCQGCGAPLEARWNKIVIVCPYCGSQNTPGDVGEPVPSSFPDDGRLRLAVGGRTYLIHGLLAKGDSSYVYHGRWVKRLGEPVVVKILRCSSDQDLFRREQAFLRRLHESPARGTHHFATRIPEPISMGPVRLRDTERLVSVYRWRVGYLHTLEDVMRVHPKGVGAKVAVWSFKRLLEVLHWSHASGVLHGAVLPPHVLIHPRDHGVMLIGWNTAVSWSPRQASTLPAISQAWKTWYPAGREACRATDTSMAARCVLRAAGASPRFTGSTLPRGLDQLFVAAAKGQYEEAWELRQCVSDCSLEELGPPTYSPLAMPGWAFDVYR